MYKLLNFRKLAFVFCVFTFFILGSHNAEAGVTKKYDFNVNNGYAMNGPLIISNGKFYGTAISGGANGYGAIFEYDNNTNTYTDIYDLDGVNGDRPNGPLLESNGFFYGTTQQGGANGYGVIFKFDPDTSTYTDLYDFNIGVNGNTPRGSLIEYSGTFYGLTTRGGTSNIGVIYAFDPNTNTYTSYNNVAGGRLPSSLLAVSNGKLYGVAPISGGSGTLFEFNPITHVTTKKHDFTPISGSAPVGSLTLLNGKFYGLANDGANGFGVIYEYDPNTNTYTDVHDFDNTNGKFPAGSMIISNSKLYGVTIQGGLDIHGIIFEYDPSTDTLVNKYNFYTDSGIYSPTISLIESNNKFYGITGAGGTSSNGVIYEWDPTNFAPTATNASITGTANIGDTLTGNYTYADVDNDLEGASTYSWYRDDVAISGANSNTYVLTTDDAHTTIKFGVQPVANTGVTPGVLLQSSGVTTTDSIPVATSVSISGNLELGTTLTGQYTYSDTENDPEGASTFQWYRNNDVIAGATSMTYIVTADDINKTVKFEVTPVADIGLSPGIAVSFNVTPYILYESADTDVTPGSPGTLGTADNLASIYSTDSDYWTTALSVTDGGYDSQVFKINLDSSGITNPKFSVVWRGHGDVPTDKMVTISFYNFITSAWEQVDAQHCATDCTLTGNKTGTKYTDVDGNTWVWVKADNYVPLIEISNLVFSNISHTLTWNTNVPANSEIMYSSNAYSKWDQYNEKAFGATPYGSLTEYNGLFYGMTSENESNSFDVGTIFEYNPDTSTYTDKFHFNSINGANPKGSLINVNGVFYGTTYNGGANSSGTLFAWDPVTNTITKQYDFNTTDGAQPYGSLINISGILYGTTSSGGANGVGTLFAWDPVTNTIIKQYDFNTTDGSNPSGSLVNISGILYGTTGGGGTSNGGIIFAWDPVTNTITEQYDFNTTNGEGPAGSLINISGILYGTTNNGGANNYGTLFAWDPVTNTITNQYDFDYTNGSYPRGDLIESNGKFYGLASNGGSAGAGLIFEYDFNTSTYTVLHEYINNIAYYTRDDAMVTSHSISVTYGTPTLYYIVRSTDASSNVATSEIGGPYASSCPYIFVWDGEKYVFVTDASSSATLSIGLDRATWAANPFYKDPNTNNNYPNPEGYAKIQSGNLVARTVGNETFYDIKNTTELNEINYFDSTSLKIIDHDASVNVFPDYRENGQIHTVAKNAPAPVSVIDQDGEDVTSLLSQNDGVYYHSKLNVTPAYIDIKLSNDETTPANLKLLIERGKEGPFSGGSGSDTLQYKNEAGEFVDVPSEYNVFVTQREGAPYPSRLRFNSYGVETKVIDLSGLTIKDNTIRLIMTNTKRMWDIDYLAVDTNPDSAITVTSENPYYADLHFRGISSKVRTNPNDPNMILTEPVYSEVTDAFISNKTIGNATKYGDVTELLQSNDDKFVIMTQGDELAFKYAVPFQAPGTERDFIYYTNDYHKAYIYALGDEIGPLPFSAMTQYPYHSDVESYPTDAEHNTYQSTYNTREINFTGLRSDIVPGQLHHSLNTDYFTATVMSHTSVTYGSYASGYGSKVTVKDAVPSSTSVQTNHTQCNEDQILTQNLKAGARNGIYNSFTKAIVKEVKILQAHMNRLGFAAGKEDGILGPITDGAIKRMQKSLGTKQDGLVGPLTRALINNSCGAKA